jgi:C-terminal processing protease CtpA/Prc
VASKINELPFSEHLDKDFASREESDLNETLYAEFNKKRNGFYYYADSLISKWTPDDFRFSGKVYVITNATTVSAASYFALLIKKAGIGKIIGTETAGGSYSGNGFKNLEYVLPKSYFKLIFPYAHMVYSLKENQNTGRGVIPDYIVPDTYESFKNNEDKQVRYIVDSIILN